jgi:murein tripeptide amidase MpaA
MVTVPLDRFLRFPELTEVLQAMAAEHPELLDLSVVGRSHENREIWLATVTNTATGPHDEKPAIWIDANIHATELTGSTAALHLLDRLVSGHGTDPEVTRALDTRTFYVVPRMGPDGAELALAERPRFVRSSVRPWPRLEQEDGLVPSDIDADGRILSMRVPDPNGAWKQSGVDRRLMVPRDPIDDGGSGPYYRLLTEGEIQGYDGVRIPKAPPLAGLDMNRNYPGDWGPPGAQLGAGPYPTSEPEVRTVVQAIVDRPNICAFIQYHTYSGVQLRPYGHKPDDEMPTFDLRVFKEIGAKATEITGYPAVSVYHDFRYDPKDCITGVADDWAYDHLGVHAWTTEFWNPLAAAGIEAGGFIEWWNKHPLDDDLKLLAWVDENLPGRGYVDWYPWEHPQLGTVEIGGWDTAVVLSNPPPALLAAEVKPHPDWAIWHVLISPRLAIREVSATPAGDGAWRVRLVVENTGYLPTQVTQKALDRKAVRPVEAELGPAEGCTIVAGDRRQELGQLEGRALKHSMLGLFSTASDGTPDRAKAEWVVQAPAGTEVQVTARHQRAGVALATVTLGGA